MKSETINLYLPSEIVKWMRASAESDSRTPSNWLTVKLRKLMSEEQVPAGES